MPFRQVEKCVSWSSIPEQVNDSDMVLLARDISKQIESELEYPGQIKVNL